MSMVVARQFQRENFEFGALQRVSTAEQQRKSWLVRHVNYTCWLKYGHT